MGRLDRFHTTLAQKTDVKLRLAAAFRIEDILDTSKIKFYGDFDRQVAEVLQYVRLQRSRVEQLDTLYKDLHDVLSLEWTSIRVMGFGSIVTGLGIKTSDVDCYIELPSWLHPPDKSFVTRAKNILMQYPHIFQQTFAIVHAKVPIVKFYHVPTKMNCDVSFTSSAGVQNSKLIEYLLHSDERAFQLAILVKYWSKVHNLTGTNLMPNYGLTLLVIFFLQQLNILEPVADLQENTEEIIVDNWNTAFQRLDHTSDSTKSVYQLLGEFFKYYKTFDYEDYIISPYLGRPIKKELFMKIETVPLNFSLYKLNVRSKKVKPIRLDSVMCVQDPFEHNRNCTVAVYPRLLQRVVQQITTAASNYENNSEDRFLKSLLSVIPKNTNVVDNDDPNNRTQAPVHGVRKHYRRNLYTRNFKQTARNFQNSRHFRHNNFRGRNQWN